MNENTENRVPSPTDVTGMRTYILNRYGGAIDYYWKASRYNKRAYKLTRYLTVILGAVVTLVASISSAEFVEEWGWATPLAILTPVLAALLAIVGGFSQSFQWGAAWQEMVLIAERLEKERDRIQVTLAEHIDAQQELEHLNELVIAESRGFFGRIVGRVTAPDSHPS